MESQNLDSPLKGLCVLIVEDELLAAMDLEEIIESLGATVIGPTGMLEEAQRLVEENDLSGAILDVKLDHTTSLELAGELMNSGTPVILATGYEADMLPERFAEVPRLMKPYSVSAVRKLTAQHFRVAV